MTENNNYVISIDHDEPDVINVFDRSISDESPTFEFNHIDLKVELRVGYFHEGTYCEKIIPFNVEDYFHKESLISNKFVKFGSGYASPGPHIGYLRMLLGIHSVEKFFDQTFHGGDGRFTSKDLRVVLFLTPNKHDTIKRMNDLSVCIVKSDLFTGDNDVPSSIDLVTYRLTDECNDQYKDLVERFTQLVLSNKCKI